MHCSSHFFSFSQKFGQSNVQDIYNALRIDLRSTDKEVLSMMKENPKIEINEEDGQLYFRYRAKYEIRYSNSAFVLKRSNIIITSITMINFVYCAYCVDTQEQSRTLSFDRQD